MLPELTNLTNITSQEAFKLVHKSFITPSLIFLYVVLEIVFLFGLLLFDYSAGKSKYMMAWLLFTALGGIVVITLVLAPNFVQSILNFINNLFT